MYDTVQHKLKDQVYTAGLHAGPPGYTFIIFPRVYKSITYKSLKCLNKDGVSIELNVQFQYLVSLAKGVLVTVIKQFRDHDNFKKVVS